MKKIFLLSAIITLFAACNCNKTTVSMILKNCKVYTADSSFTIAECIAVTDGFIVAVGSNDEVMQKYESDSVIDLSGAFVYPGFIDAHCHFYGYGLNLTRVDFSGTNSFEEVLASLDVHYKKHHPAWLLGRGWDQNLWDVKEFPDNSLLDSLFPGLPVFITRVDGHAAIASSRALELAGISPSTIAEGGEIGIKNGRLSGLLLDNAMDLVKKVIPEPTPEDITHALVMAQSNCFAAGLTTVADAGLEYKVVHIIDSLHKKGALLMRIYAMLEPTEENFKNFVYQGLYRTPSLNVRSLKLYADGALGSRGALLKKQYSDDAGNTGIAVETEVRLKDFCLRSYNYGYQVCIHAIGDSAVSEVLKIYADILAQPNDKRWRIEHAQVVDPADLTLFERFNIIPSVQPTHATSDMGWAINRLGAIRVKWAYAYKKLLESAGTLCFGTDFPVENINPLLTFYSAVARKDANGKPANGWQMENVVDRKTALLAMTIWAARACFEEDVKGSLEPGKYADFTVLDRDIMSIPENEIPAAKVLFTFVGGKVVFQQKKN